MTRSRSAATHDKIHAALKKLKDESNAKELELVDLVSSIYETIKDTQDRAVEKVKDTAQDVNTSVHLHPWYYIGGAGLVGLVLGLFIKR